MMNSIIKKIPKIARTVLVLVFWILVWHIVALAVAKEVLISTPADTIKNLFEFGKEKEFYVIIASSVFRILALFWLSKETIPSFISSLMVLPIIHGNVSEGLKNTPNELIEMTKVYNFTPAQKLTKLYLPTVLPYFVAGFKTSLGLAWKAGVAAEVIAYTKNSIGKELNSAKIYLETLDVFTWTLTVIIISMVLEKLLIWTVTKLTEKRKRGNAK